MTVETLIQELGKLPKDIEVLLGVDDEGNGFREIPEGWVGVERFNSDMEIVAIEDLDLYDKDDIQKFVVIG